MLDTIVRYLHESLVPFRLSSYPSLEALPRAATPIPKGAVEVDTQLALVGDKLAILCFGAGESIDLSALGYALGAPVVDATVEDRPEALRRFEAAPPPLGQLYGLPVVLDERVTGAGVIVFRPFGESDYLEIPYDDFARQEQPRVASFARKGELPRHPAEGPREPAVG
jgi:Ala-tRNA(Pro) deacylase